MKRRYVIEARGDVADRYAHAEYGRVGPTARCACALGAFSTQREALRVGLVRVVEIASQVASTATSFGSIVLIDTRTGREEFVR